MQGDYVGGSVADDTSADVTRDLLFANGHHWHRGVGGQPIGFVVTAGVVTHVVGVTEEEWHGTESSHTRSGPT